MRLSLSRHDTPVVIIERAWSEETFHKQAVLFLRAVLPRTYVVHHSPNGGFSRGRNGKAKGMGTVAGWPDLEIFGCRPTGEPHAFFVELKTNRGKLSDSQQVVHSRLTKGGFGVYVARTIDQVRDILDKEGVKTREVRAP